MKIENISKSYGNLPVLEDITYTFQEGGIYALMGASGRGKTTLLHILLGLVKPDSGRMEQVREKKFSAVFQENRLFEFLTPIQNVTAVQKNAVPMEETVRALEEILPRTSLEQRISRHSGGMKRRTAIARAMLTESDVVVMDEPFTGLDENTREMVIAFIRRHLNGRTLIFSTHQEEDVSLLGAVLLRLT